MSIGKPVFWTLLAVLMLLGLGGAYWMRSATASFHLLTAEELSERNRLIAVGEDSHRAVNVTRKDGPAITFASPSRDVLASPVNIDVNIQPRNGVPVDMSSIRIDYRMGPAWVNVTGRIMKYASVSGSRLSARAAELPSGRHTMRLSVKDQDHRQSQVTVSFEVR